jgi:2,4-dienoyl-CoA reductase-like NADH-dependent reductase (Old Yellow Enzyme family)
MKGVLKMSGRQESIVFSPGRIGQVEIKNRLVRSATYENVATAEGQVSDKLIEIYETLAKGGIGLIITGATSVHPKGIGLPRMMRLDNDSCISSLKKIPRVVRRSAPDCKVMLQIVHPGRQVWDREKASRLVSVLPPAMLAYIQRHPEVLVP